MDTLIKLMAVVVLSSCGMSYGTEHDLKSITTTMDAYEKRTDCIRLKYTCMSAKLDEEGNRNFVKGSFAQNRSKGYVLLDEKKQRGKAWDDDKTVLGQASSYNGQITRYLKHELNRNGHFQAALLKVHNPNLYLTGNNPYYRVWRVNYKTRLTDLVNDPNGMAKVLGEEPVDGVKTIKIAFKAAEGTLDCNLWLLPDKNYLPIKYKTYRTADGGEQWEMRWSEFKELADGVWYPMNIKLFFRGNKYPTTLTIDEMDISPLTKSDFEFKFPALAHVTDETSGTSYLIED